MFTFVNIRREIFIDNYDDFTEESSRKKTACFENISALIRKYQTGGVHFIVVGSLRKVFAAPNFGIALRSADAVNRLNGKFPRSLAEVELPMGRAFIVRSEVTSMLKLVTPYANDDDVEGSLDAWVQHIKKRYPKNAQRPAKRAEDKSEKKLAKIESLERKVPDLSKYDIALLKSRLVEMGLTEEMLAFFQTLTSFNCH